MQLLFKVLDTTPEVDAVLGNTDFRAHYSAVNKNLSWYALKTSLRKVTKEFLIPFVGLDFYNTLATKYKDGEIVGDPDAGIVIGDPVTGIIIGDGDITAQEGELLELLRDALAEYVIWYSISERIITISDAGIRLPQDGEGLSSPALAWQIKNFAWSRMLRGDKYLDMALAYLDANQGDFAYYDNTLSSLEVADFYIGTGAEAKKYLTLADNRRTWIKLWPALRNANRREVIPILGDTLASALLDAYRAGTMDTAHAALLPYVQALTAHAALLEMLPKLPVMIEEEGIRTITSTDGMNTKQLAHERRMEALLAQVEKDYNNAKEELLRFLFSNLDTYPDFKEGEVYLEVAREDTKGIPYTFGPGGVFLT